MKTRTLLYILIAVAVLAVSFCIYCFQCETIVIAIKCTLVMGTIASVLTYGLIHYDNN